MIGLEWGRQWRRPRTLLALAAVVLFPIILTIALVALGPSASERVGDVPLFIVPSTSGFSVPVIALSSTMKFFLPLAVAIFAGESIAGEAGWGTLRYALVHPMSRSRYLFTKLVVAMCLSFAAVVLVPAVALGIGTAAFGWHPFVATSGAPSAVASSVVATFGPGLALGKLALSTLYVAAGMVSIFAFAFFLSTVTTRPFVAVAGGVALTILSRVLNADYLPGVAVANSYMPNNDIDLWQHLFAQPQDTSGMAHFLILQGAYTAVFLGAAWWWFVHKDVLT